MPDKEASSSRNLPALPLVGAHVSTAGGLGHVPARAHALGAEVVQVFSSNPRMWQARMPSGEELDGLVTGLKQSDLPLFFHSIYLINLATPDDEIRSRSIEALASSLVLGALTGAAGVVTHVGSHRGAGRDAGCLLAAAALAEVISRAGRTLARVDSKLTMPRLLLETGPGGGNSISSRLQDLAVLLTAMPEGTPLAAVGICIDTAHLHAAGYRLDEEAGLADVLEQLAELDLLDRLGLVHLNDSASLAGSRQDRHANPGDGQIGYEALARVVRHPALASVPFVLETPGLEGPVPTRPISRW